MTYSAFAPGWKTSVFTGTQLNDGVTGVIQQLASYNATPSNPTGTSSTSAAKMVGLAGAITPGLTGNVLFMVSGDVLNSGAIADGAKIQLSYGTGAAPANAAALAGTQVGGNTEYIASTTAGRVPFCVQAVVTGLAVGTAYWIDLALEAVTGGTATVENLSVTAVEIG